MVKKSINFLLENSLLLLIGAILALIWANLDAHSYHHVLEIEILRNPWFGYLHEGHRVINLHYLVNDILMTLFFAIAGKEVWEATLPGGPLNNPKQAAVPLISAVGGMAVPAAIYAVGAGMFGDFAQLSSGWAIPCATDIAFSYMAARLIFGPAHPAIPFLLLLAIADDALGLIVLAVFYPQEEMKLLWLLLPVLGVILGCVFRRMKLHSFWWYITIPGIISWIGLAKAGIHPALGLLPIIPTLPHAHMDKGLFNWEELDMHDTLNEFEHWWKYPVEIILGFFALFNAGVVFNAIGLPTYLVLIGLLVGKPIGIWSSGMFTAKIMRFGLPQGIDSKTLWVIGCAAGIGFTVALFVATVAFPPGDIQDAAKMGALASFTAVIVTYVFAIILKTEKVKG